LSKKIGLVSLGCPKNLVDSELMLGVLKNTGYEIVSDVNEAQIIIINTCGFIEDAKQESIDTIIEMAAYKEKNCELLIVAGCLAERYREQILDEIPEVDAVLGTGSYSKIADIIKSASEGSQKAIYAPLEGIEYLEGERIISTGKGYAYLKIAEGCDNCCTYCIIPSLRGRYRSRKLENIVKEAETLAKNGIKEVILVAQDTTRYGIDLYGEEKLVELIQRISKVDGIEWIRLLYCYPDEIDQKLIDEIANNEKVCKYLDIPIQHASDNVLKKMGRRGTAGEIKELIEKLRTRIKGLIIRTTLIVGFPGETEEDYGILTDFVAENRFDRLGIFMYSKEDGTPAGKMQPQVPAAVKRARHRKLMKIQSRISEQLNFERLGKEYRCLVEGVADDGIFYFGRSYAEAPEIDGKIYFTSPEPLEIGQMVNVKILDCDQYDLTGEVKDEFAK